MNGHTKPIIKCTEIRDILREKDSDEVYFHYSNWAKTLVPFWQNAILQIAEQTAFNQKNVPKHLAVSKSAFELMDAWRSGSIKIVKTRRSEIDSAISYMRNGALVGNVSALVFSPICRNAAGALRGCLQLASGSYSNEQLSTVVAQNIYSIAAVRTLFPVEDSNLISYLPANVTIHGSNNPDDLDNYHLMFEIAAARLDLSQQVISMNKEAAIIWQNFEQPAEWEIPAMIWTEKSDSLSSKLYYTNMAQFHAQGN
jgi:hypothetical protein